MFSEVAFSRIATISVFVDWANLATSLNFSTHRIWAEVLVKKKPFRELCYHYLVTCIYNNSNYHILRRKWEGNTDEIFAWNSNCFLRSTNKSFIYFLLLLLTSNVIIIIIIILIIIIVNIITIKVTFPLWRDHWPVAAQALTAGSYLPVWPTISGGAKLHIKNGYFSLSMALHIYS